MVHSYAKMQVCLVIEWQRVQKIESGKSCKSTHEVGLFLVIEK
ncbi:hypothetical protein BN2497_3219 [Janthinobacterium sp. CG23_2]|nr:hypothetical protein BN2497_3219 [Janthinobacterium sp. CG23_2]CUU28007.1 hypothetical protein BN3177_3219 [Janthinobacterium sp. CG23_2]